MLKNKINIIICIPILLCMLFQGGIYELGVSVTLLSILAGIIFIYFSKEKVYKRSISFVAIGLCLLLLFSVIANTTAIDRGLNIFGSYRILVLLIFYYLIVSTDNQISQIIDSIPLILSVHTLLGIVALLIPPLKAYLYQAGRFGGLLQYANTCALLYLLGLWILAASKSKNRLSIVYLLLLLAGLLMTGSRSIILLLIISCIYLYIKNKSIRIPIICSFLGSLIAIVIYSLITNSFQNVARILTVVNNQSTMWGRILYSYDGIKVLIKHPLGLGYMGYFFTQGTFQTGVYTTRFVHNDILQTGLDYGIPALVLIIGMFVYQLVKGKQSRLYKELLCIIFVACLIDFHAQYLFIDLLIIMLLDWDVKKEKQNNKSLLENKILSGIGIIVALYMVIAFVFYSTKKYDKCLYMLPNYTFASVEMLNNTLDISEAKEMANSLISKNKYLYDAHHMLVYIYATEQNWDAMKNEMLSSLQLAPYDISIYIAYDNLLSDIENDTNTETVSSAKHEMRSLLSSLETRTSSIALKIKDKPVYNF